MFKLRVFYKYFVTKFLHFMLRKETFFCYQEINKKASSGLVRKFTKKTRIQFESSFFRKFFLIMIAFGHLETCHFHIKVPLITNETIPNEKKH